MTLKDYVNFRGRSTKTTEYQRRTQHFYDGKRIVVDMVAYPGIPANFMNTLSIPTAQDIAKVQRDHFITIHKTQAQKDTLSKLSSLNASGFSAANALLETQILSLIHNLEQGVNQIVQEKNKIKKLSKSNLPIDYSVLNKAYNDFKIIYQQIKQQAPVGTIDKYFDRLENYMQIVDSNLKASPSALIDNNLKSITNKNTNFVNQLVNLSYQIKGVSLLEHAAIKFIQEKVALPEDIEIIGTGQILVAGKQASQDALFLPRKLQIKLDNGKTVNFAEYVKENHSETVPVSLSFNEWGQLFTQGAIGLQSKYSQYGHIKMSNVSMREILNLDLQQTKALRMLYILNNQIDINGKVLVSHKFNIKKSGKAQEDYKQLFSYGLCKYMDKILSHNHYMVTAKNQIIDSDTYYRNLFDKGRYFRPGGTIDLNRNALDYRYPISIQEN